MNSCDEEEVVLSLVVTDAGDGNENDFVVWQEPRLVLPGRPEIYLRDIQGIYWDAGLVQPPNAAAGATQWGLDPAMFGKHPNGKTIAATSLFVRVPSVVKIRLPGYLGAGRKLVTTAVLDQEVGREGSVQVDVVIGAPASSSGWFPARLV